MNQLVIDSVPPIMKGKAKILICLLKNNQNVSWKDDSTLILYDKYIPESNIIDLVNYVIIHKKNSGPTG